MKPVSFVANTPVGGTSHCVHVATGADGALCGRQQSPVMYPLDLANPRTIAALKYAYLCRWCGQSLTPSERDRAVDALRDLGCRRPVR